MFSSAKNSIIGYLNPSLISKWVQILESKATCRDFDYDDDGRGLMWSKMEWIVFFKKECVKNAKAGQNKIKTKSIKLGGNQKKDKV